MICRECKREISSQAAVCPHCGIKVSSHGGTGTGFWIVLAIVTGLPALVLIDRSNQGVEITANSSVAANAGNTANDHMLALPAAQQATALGRIVAERCVGIEAFYQGMVKGQAFWSVRCSSGEVYQIAVNPDAAGSTRVLGAATHRRSLRNASRGFSQEQDNSSRGSNDRLGSSSALPGDRSGCPNLPHFVSLTIQSSANQSMGLGIGPVVRISAPSLPGLLIVMDTCSPVLSMSIRGLPA